MKASMLPCAALLVALLAGCVGESTDLLFVRPDQYDYLNCPELAAEKQTATQREEELRTLTERAEKDAFGSVMAFASYRSEYLKTQGQLRLLAEASQKKNCAPDVTPSKPVYAPPKRR